MGLFVLFYLELENQDSFAKYDMFPQTNHDTKLF